MAGLLLSLEAALSLVSLGVLGTGFAYIAYLWLIETIGSVGASLEPYVIPVVGSFWVGPCWAEASGSTWWRGRR